MPLFNRRGDLAFGQDRYIGLWRAGQPRPIAPVREDANAMAWVTDDVYTLQPGAFSDLNQHVELSTGRRYKVAVNYLVANGGRWCGYLGTAFGRLYVGGLIDPSVRLLEGMAKPSLGEDGTLAYGGQNGRGVTIEAADGTRLKHFPTETVWATATWHQSAVAWFPGGTTLRLWRGGATIDTATLAFPTLEGRLFTWRGGLWVIYVTNVIVDGAILHAVDDPTRGYVVGTYNRSFHPDAREVDGRLHVAWSTTAGERLDDIQRQMVTAAPQPWPVPSLPIQTALQWRALDGSNSDGTLVTQVGNAAWGQPPDARPVVEGMPWAHGIPGPLLGVLLGTEGDNNGYPTKRAQADATIAEARRRGCGVFVSSDDPTWTAKAETLARWVLAAGLPVVRVVQAVLQPNESAEEGVARVAAELRRPLVAGGLRGTMERTAPLAGVSPVIQQRFTVGLEWLRTRTALDGGVRSALQLVFQVRRAGADPGTVRLIETACARMPSGTPPALWPPVPQPEPPDPGPDPTPPDPPVVEAAAPWPILWRGGQP